MWCVAAVLIGCGTVNDRPDAVTDAAAMTDATAMADAARIDASSGSDAAGDAAPARCDPAGTFDTPVVLTGFATAADETSVSLSPDELTLYLSSNDTATTSGAHDIYIAQRASLSDPFTGLTPLAGVNSPSGPGGVEDYDPTISADGKTLIFSSNRKPSEGFHLYVATRSSTLAAFSTPAPLMGVAAPTVTANDVQPSLTADGQELWFTSDRNGTYKLFHASLVNGAFANAMPAQELNSSADEATATLTGDRLTIYFSSARTGSTGGSDDIWTAHRSSTSDGFGTPTPVNELNTATSELSDWLSPDNCRLYIRRRSAHGDADIYVATRHL
jgi:Tol biopolymer transport system component